MFRSGQQVGLYTLITKLGRGGFGEVWLAEKRSQFVTKKVAVKLPHEEQVNFDAIRQEATLWEQASGHPNVLPIIDADVYDGQVVIVSEYADGGSLADKLKREDKLSLKQSVEMAIGILSGLEFLHSRQIIHRDIKPQNILLQGNTPRLADFGISRAMNTTVVSSAIIGTDAYMSPESFDGKRNAQTDIWSVGVVLYQLLKGSLPFPQEHPSERMFAVLTKEFELLPDEVPADLRRIVQKALAKQPEQRYRTAEEMREELRKALTYIEHPTFAPTEVLIKPDLSFLDSNSPTVSANEQTPQENKPFVVPVMPPVTNQAHEDETEIKTIVDKTPESNPNAFNQPAPTQPSFPQNSIATQVNPNALHAPENPFPAQTGQESSAGEWKIVGKPLNGDTKNKRTLTILGVAALVMLLVGVYAAPKIYRKLVTISHQQQQLNEARKIDPYYVESNIYPFEENKKYGYKTSDGKVVIPPKYETAGSFNDGLAFVKLNNKYGFIDEKDNVVIPFKYDDAWFFRLGLACVKLDSKAGFIDLKGNYAIPPIYDTCSYFSDVLAKVQRDGKYGFIDKTGKEIVPLKYIYAGDFYDKFAMVCSGDMFKGNCGLMNNEGREVSPLKYDTLSIMSEDRIAFTLNKKCGYLDSTGKEVIPAKYDYAGPFINGTAEVHLNDRKLRVDKNGNETDIGPLSTPSSNTSSTPYMNTNMTIGNTTTTNMSKP